MPDTRSSERDNWRLDRSEASDDDLIAVAPNRIFSIQLSDAARRP
jgi:hypothetical protein